MRARNVVNAVLLVCFLSVGSLHAQPPAAAATPPPTPVAQSAPVPVPVVAPAPTVLQLPAPAPVAEPNWSTGNVLTIASVLITGVSAFFATNWKMRQSQHEQAITLNAMAAHQQESTALLSQSVVALKETASSMQAVLSEQQKQLNSMMLEVEVARRIREAKNVAGDKSA